MLPVIALDCDDVLYPYRSAFHAWVLAENHASSEQLEEAYENATFDTGAILGVSRARAHELEQTFLAGPGLLAPPIEGAVEGVLALAGLAELHVVTARVASLHEDSTRSWLRAHFSGAITGVEFTRADLDAPGRTKHQICVELGASVLVDDYTVYLDSLAGSGVVPVLFGALPWSQHSTHERVLTWERLTPHLRAVLGERQT